MALQNKMTTRYNPKLLVSKNEFNANDICDICKNLCNQATDIGCKNGHIFCKQCIMQLFSNNVNRSTQYIKCPTCNERIKKNKVNINKYAIKSISKYVIYCIHSDYEQKQQRNQEEYDEGKVLVTDNVDTNYCPWSGTISNALDHINNDCEFAKIKCEYCGVPSRRRNLPKHSLGCPMFPVECLLKCNKKILRSKMNDHVKNDCPEAFIKCCNEQCNAKIQRKHAKNHSLECAYHAVSCKYRKVGCSAKIFQKDMQQHLDEKEIYHLNLKINSMQMTINSLKQKVICNDDFSIIFENNDAKLLSYISCVNLNKRKTNNYYTFSPNNTWIKNVDASYCSTNLKECNLYIDTDYNYNDSSDPIFDDIHSKHNVIIRVGGKNELPNIVYVVESGDYKKLPELNIPRYGCHSIYSKIYGLITVGGRTRKTHHPLSSFEVFGVTNQNQNQEEKENFNWAICSKQQCMSKARCVPSLCLLNNKLVVCGGSNDNYNDNGSKNPAKKSCEIFDNDVRKWSFLSNMNNEYCAAGICTIDNSQKIAIAVDYHAELYDSHKNKWFAMPNMKSKHTLYPLLFMNKKCNDTLIIIGNDGTSKNISKWGDIEFIDLRQKSKGWMKFSSLPEFLKFDKYDCRNRYFQQICKLN
eukprot:345013_1